MATEIVFFDIDDTLCRFGQLHELSRAALQRLHAAGVKMAIATGRSMAMLPPDIRDLIDAGMMEALVSANGQYNVLQGEVISHYPLPGEDVAALIAICREYGVAYQQLSRDHIAWSSVQPSYEHMRKIFPCCVVDGEYYRRHTIYQLSVFLPESEEYPAMVDAFAALGYHMARWHRGGADLVPQSGSKARGIADVCRALGVEMRHTMAFGDGLNDLEMLQAVGIGVAMGDGWPQLREVADYVTGSIEEDGIAQALRHFAVLRDGEG